MEVFFAIALIVVIALLATSARLYRIRRTRAMSLLVSGGWLALAVGVALGPAGSGLIKADTILSTTPLLIASLGWVGLMIGLQGRLDLLARLPRGLLAIVALDFLATTLIIGLLCAFSLTLWTRADQPWTSLLKPTAALVAASLGWAMETRSLASNLTPTSHPIALAVRLTGGLAAIGAVAAFGLAEKLVSPLPASTTPLTESGALLSDAATRFTPGAGLLSLLLTLALAALAGLLGRFAIGATATRSGGPGTGGDQLAVFLGLVALVAGLAAELGSSPLLAAMMTGLVVANLSTPHLLRFERFIIQAEHILAVLIFLLAGLLLNVRISWPELALASAIALCRAAFKPALFAWGYSKIHGRLASPNSLIPTNSAGALRFSCIRQSAVAAPIVLGLTLLEPSDFHRTLLTIVVLAGLLAALFAVTLAAWDNRSAPRPDSPPPEDAP